MYVRLRKTKAERVLRRRQRWGGPGPLSPTARRQAWLNALFVDHQILRWIFHNSRRVDDQAWLSAQPSPDQLRRWKARGVRTVVNLRGPSEFGSYALEREACARLGLDYVEIKTYSSRAPRRDHLLALPGQLDAIQYPALFHCKAGADRAGMMGALYLILRQGRPVAEARRQLSWRWGHWRWAKTGVLDAFFDAYQAAAPEGRPTFLDWVRDGYDPDRLEADFKARGLAAFIVTHILRRE